MVRAPGADPPEGGADARAEDRQHGRFFPVSRQLSLRRPSPRAVLNPCLACTIAVVIWLPTLRARRS